LLGAINSADIGVKATISGDSLSLSSTAGSALQITSSVADQSSSGSLSFTNASLGYTNNVTGADGTIVVDGNTELISSNTVTNMIPGVTFQVLATTTSDSPVQVVIGNYTSGVETAMEAFVSDYNSLLSAMNVQESKDASGNAEPLYGSPTLSLLQQDILGGINASNPNGYLDSISANGLSTISGSMTIQSGTGPTWTFVVGSGTNTTNTYYAGRPDRGHQCRQHRIDAGTDGDRRHQHNQIQRHADLNRQRQRHAFGQY
jgi:flagellar hook-associated protein 2